MKKMKNIIRNASIAVLLILTGTVGASAKETITVTDLVGRNVTVLAPAERVVVTFNVEEYLAVAGPEALPRLVGWSRNYWQGRREWIWKRYLESLPEVEDVADVGYVAKKTFSAEKVISLAPDLVIMYRDYARQADTEVKRFEAAGIPVIFVDYHTGTVESHVASTLLLGRVLGKEARARELADLYRSRVAAITERVAEIDPRERPKVYVEGGFKGPGEFGNSYGDIMWGALIKQAGGHNIAEGVIERWGPISPELVIAEDPDIIIITGSYWPKNPTSMKLGYYADALESQESLAAFTKRPGWDRLKAVRNGRVYAIHHGLSRHIYDFVALEFFAKIFHPDRFEDLDPERSFRDFHDAYLPVEFGGLWMMKLATEEAPIR